MAGAGAVDSRFCTQVYAAELAPPKLRGRLFRDLFNVFISAGILAVFALGARGTDDGVWRWMAVRPSRPRSRSAWACTAAGCESPRWLAQQAGGRGEEAAERLFGRGAAADEACTVPEPAKRRHSRSVAWGLVLWAASRFAGTAHQAHGVVLEGAGLSEASARAGHHLGRRNWFAVLMASGVARFGRRPLLIASAMGATAALTAMATFTETQELSASLAPTRDTSRRSR